MDVAFLHVAPPVASMACFFAPYKTTAQIRKAQSTGDLPAITFVSMVVMCAIWGTYGILRADWTVFLPNLLGCVLGGYYLRVFETYNPKQGHRAQELKRCYFAGIGLLTMLFAEVITGNPTMSTGVVGTCGAVLSVIFAASPLAAIPAVIRQRSPDSIPLTMSVMLFTSAALWTAYGVRVADDRSIYMPNAVGAAVSAIQLLIHVVFALRLVARREPTMGASGGNKEGVRIASL